MPYIKGNNAECIYYTTYLYDMQYFIFKFWREMSFIKLGSDYLKEGYTQVDNVFLLHYLPAADSLDVKIYLSGLCAASYASEEFSTLEKMALSLHISEDRLLKGFAYWEEKGILTLTKTQPMAISYNSVKRPLPPIIRYNAQKYKTFVEEVNRLYPDRILTPNEYNALIETIALHNMEINAMLLIIQYCKELGGDKTSIPYILAVANDWLKQGLNTEKAVSARILELENNSADIRAIFDALGLKRSADLEDRQLYLKWTTTYTYRLDAILVAARAQKKRGGMQKLDEYLDTLNKAEAYTAEEVANFTKNREKVHTLSIDLSKALGTYYGSMDSIIENYVLPWLTLGFDGDALLKLANFCLLRNIRSFDGLQQIVSKFYKKGLTSTESIQQYVETQILIDDKIREVFDKCGSLGIINNKDRDSYRTWLEWGFDEDTILLVAEQNKNTAFPLQNINRTLASLSSKGTTSFEAVKKHVNASTKTDKGNNESYAKHQYTEEQLKNVLSDFENWE